MRDEEPSDILTTTVEGVVEGEVGRGGDGSGHQDRAKVARHVVEAADEAAEWVSARAVRRPDSEAVPGSRVQREGPARELEEQGYSGSYVTVQRYVRPLRTAAQPETATTRFETAPRRQAQVDSGMLKVWIGQAPVDVHLFVMVLEFSRRIFTKAYVNEKLGNLLDDHEAAFAYFGGTDASILYARSLQGGSAAACSSRTP